MKLFNVGFIICLFTVQSQGEKYGTHYSHRGPSHEHQILEPPESRYRSSQRRDYPSYNGRIIRKESADLPVTFKAPPYDQPDYWKSSEEYSNRRTFFGDFPGDVKPLQGLYQFMSSVFNGREDVTSEYPETYHYNHNRAAPQFVTPVTKYVTPYRFPPTEPNYIPPPKPIRASVIKLETITRSPLYSSFEYETTAKYYPPVKAILNQVLIENSRPRQNVTWYHEELPERVIPPFKPLPVLPKPQYVPATTLKPNYYTDHSHASFEYYNKTDYKYPDSVQDQLPHVEDSEEVRIPYEPEKSVPHIYTSPPKGTPPEEYYPSSESTTQNFPIDIRNLDFPNANRRERPINVEFVTTTVKSFPGAVEKVQRPTFRYTKKLTAQLDRGPVERVTNLTVLGYAKDENESVEPPKQITNLRELINYEVDKLENGLSTRQPENSSTRSVNLNDELSLDAKILKDTNWDGLTVAETSTTELARETTTFPPLHTEKSSRAFWEIVDGQTTEPQSYTETTTTTTELIKQTTTEFFWVSSTPEPPTTEPATEKTQIRFEKLNRNLPPKPTEDTGNLEVTISSERTTSRRRYYRRPKITNFTPYPTAEEIQKKLINRNHFPKRQKPNITLSFGNKNVLKPRLNLGGKDEVMKFSDEDIRKRRKTEKRRRVYKRVRVSTSESPIQDN